jgi:hypothetical protein
MFIGRSSTLGAAALRGVAGFAAAGLAAGAGFFASLGSDGLAVVGVRKGALLSGGLVFLGSAIAQSLLMTLVHNYPMRCAMMQADDFRAYGATT